VTDRPVLVFGAAGQLGAAVVRRFSASHRVEASTRADLDITDSRAVADRVRRTGAGAVINCAAYNRVDEAEDEAALALEVNGLAVLGMARAARDAGAILVHYSSDFVFDGGLSRPYREDDPPKPQSAYAASKLAGEWFAADAPRHYVLRVASLFGGAHGTSSVDRILDALVEGRQARVFSDRTISPSYAVDVADATYRLLQRGIPPGLYHCVNAGAGLRARRPQYSALSTERLADAGVLMPTWEDALARHVSARRRGSCPS
jgi:dTDP-4-dehydrorhamnose reductase